MFIIKVCTLLFVQVLVVVSQKAMRNNIHSLDELILKEKIVMASFSHPQIYTCINTTKIDMPPDTKSVMRSQCHEDSWLYSRIFSKLPISELYGGTFLEIGAFDGLLASNTYYFEKMFDWRGVLVEGHPINSKKLLANKSQRSNSAIFTNGICNSDRSGNPGSLNFTISGDLTGTVVSLANEKFMKKWHSKETQTLEVTCIPMQSILESTGVVDIDLFSLDVEGAELFILETINFKVTNIRVILVEADGGNPEKDQAVRDFLLAEGFINAFDTLGTMKTGEDQWCDANIHNDVFINPHYKVKKDKRTVTLGDINRYHEIGTGMKCGKN